MWNVGGKEKCVPDSDKLKERDHLEDLGLA